MAQSICFYNNRVPKIIKIGTHKIVQHLLFQLTAHLGTPGLVRKRWSVDLQLVSLVTQTADPLRLPLILVPLFSSELLVLSLGSHYKFKSVC